MFAFATLFTFLVLFTFIFIIVFAASYFAGVQEMPLIISFTVGANILSWLVSPFFMDLMFRWFYKIKRVELSEIRKRSPRLASFIEKTCQEYGIKLPRFRIILDDNPTAFAFGSAQFNARLCFSEGLFTYLEEDEIEAVLGHELGHIKRRDFIIMTIAATAVQILYELSQFLMRRSARGEKKNPLALVGLVAYIFYIIGTYVLLFLSRTREYGADEFSAHVTKNPDGLSRALVKIAYGIIAKPDDASQQRLLNSTRALGPFDSRAAKTLGTAYQSMHTSIHALGPVLAFDFISPWAFIMELQSTHPLTGKRIRRLNEIAAKQGQKVSIDTESARTLHVDRHRLYSGFALGVVMHFLPWLAVGAVLAYAWLGQADRAVAFIPAAVGVSILLNLLYRYPHTETVKATTVELMSDIYASPVRGKRHALEGSIIGRGEAGAYLGEDVMLQDKTGLIYMNYESAIPILGNLIFAIGKVRKFIGKSVSATGWFFRGVGHHFDLDAMEVEGKRVKSSPRLWGVLIALGLLALSYYWYVDLAGFTFERFLG